MSTTPILSSLTRVFLIEGRASPSHNPTYESCMRMTGLSQGFGDIEKIECPDPYRYGAFIEVGQIRGATERVTTSLEGRFMLDIKSTLLELARKGCPSDIQLHVGKCQDASVFDTFSKAIILEDAYLTNYGTDDLGALASGDNAVVNQTTDVSARQMYEVMPISYATKAGSIVTTEVLDVVICDTASCGDCTDSSSGCDKIFAITKAAGGSVGTSPDIVYSLDKGVTWYAQDIDTLATTEDPNRIVCMGNYVVVTSVAAKSLNYALISQMDGVSDPVWYEVTSGFASGYPKAIYSDGTVAWVGGTQGYIYYIDDPAVAPTVLDAGSLFVTTWNRIHGIGRTFIVVVGDNGAIAYSNNGVTFVAAPSTPVGIGTNFTALWVKSEKEWWVGTSNGRLYYTVNGGVTWTQKFFSGYGTGTVYDIKFATDSVAHLAHAIVAPAAKGRIFRSINGGFSWNITPEQAGISIPANDRINAVTTCSDPNFVVGVGLADDNTDGIILVGES